MPVHHLQAGFTCHEISKNPRPDLYLNVLQLFCPSWWDLEFQWYKFTAKLWLVISDTRQTFQSHSEKAYIIGPMVAATTTYEVIFLCNPAGWFFIPSALPFFFFGSVCFSPKITFGEYFIPFVQFSKILCKRKNWKSGWIYSRVKLYYYFPWFISSL